MRCAAGSMPLNSFYRILPSCGRLCDVYLTPGEAVPVYGGDGRMDFRIRLLAVHGIDPEDPQWGGSLEEHIRRHYAAWLASAEEIEI